MAGSSNIKDKLNEINASNMNENLNDSTKKNHNVSVFDLAVLILSVFSIFVDLCTDLVLVIQYSNQGYRSWAIGTFILIFFPSLVVQFFSLRWHIVDNSASMLHWVLHFCMLGIVHRYIKIIITAFSVFKSKNSSDIQKLFLEQNDLCMLHLFESFLESAPQLVLQIYIIATLQECKFWTGLSAFASLLSLAWALAAYTKAQRRARENKNVTTWPGLLLQALWRTGMLTSRISALVMAAFCFANYIFPVITVHWLAMTVWIIYQKTDFCETYWEERIYNAVVGVIYCFCFFNLQEGQSRWRSLAFYSVIASENLIFLTIFLMWFGERTPKLSVFAFSSVIGGLIFGSTGMLFYYKFFHPSGPIKFNFYSKSPSNGRNEETFKFYTSLTLRSLKRIRCEIENECQEKNLKNCNSDSVVIMEEKYLEDSDVEIKILRDWIKDSNEKNDRKVEENEEKFITIECNNSKVMGAEEVPCSGVDSTHDYENLCAVNIARERWGVRSWRGYCDIETWLHDDSVVHDRRLDTLTSTASSELSANTVPKEFETMGEDDSVDAESEELAHSELESNSENNSFPTVITLGPLDPILEEFEENSEEQDMKSCASTLVATIDKIRMNTPIGNRYQSSESICNYLQKISPSTNVKGKFQRNCKKKLFAPTLVRVEENNATINEIKEKEISPKSRKSRISEYKEIFNKENIPTVASKIDYWNKIINIEKNAFEKETLKLKKNNFFIEKV